MKSWKAHRIVLFTALCVLLNLGGRMLAAWLQLPMWLDSFGTVLGAYVAGPVCGAIIGVTGNLIFGAINHLSIVYSITSITVGVIIGIAAQKRWLNTFYGAMKAAALTMLAALIVSVPLNWLFAGGYTGNIWGNGIIDYLSDKGWPFLICTFMGQIALEFADKVLTLFVAYVALKIIQWRLERDDEDISHTAEKIVTSVLLCCVALGAASARAQESDIAFIDYNDYVQTVYSSSNGLPCGEANDIAQTNDGVLWIGTYAGLYRYNGRDFRWIDDYDSVRNVNCLYVDAEGRLWIGTNDNGLSIAIHEKIANVIDQSTGLTSDSVRCITQSSDGYYYIGTTGSMQLLVMNNGLRILTTLREVYYADSISADDDGNVVTIASGGRMFLIRQGRILSSLQLTEGQEQFTTCAFSPDGTLIAGTSSNHIYRYDISTGGFELRDVTTCEGVTTLNELHYLDDGTLFISTDSGVSYIDTAGEYHRINTNAFNNSIDKMLMDYQGNLWFTSSRLGLLRMAVSFFKDVYGTVGMSRRVVNTIVSWQDCYYIGTDKGLDVVDRTCREQISNDLTARLSGQRIRCMLVDSDDHLWVCTYGSGLLEVAPDGESWVYDSQNGGFGDRARTLIQLSDGTILAAGNTGISYIRDHEIQRTIRNQDGLINSMILTLTERPDGTVLAGTDGDGIAILKDGAVAGMITREDGLSSGVILRTIKDPKSEGIFLVTSNGLCYLEPDNHIRALNGFPYYNNYDIFVKDRDTLLVMSSAGIYVVDRDELVADLPDMHCELLDARSGLNTALTVNSWNYYDGRGNLFLACDTGMFIIDVLQYNRENESYRMQLAALRFDDVPQLVSRIGAITINRGVNRVELVPEILNYTVQDPNVGYYLEGYDTQWTILPQSKLGSLVYTNLPAGEYTAHLAVFDTTGSKIVEEQTLRLVKIGELYEQPGFTIYMILILIAFIVWFTWFIVQRQIIKQQIKLNMANETVMAIANAVDAKDVRTSQHSTRVAEYSVMIAQEMNCFPRWRRKKELENLRKAAQMHDIGKIGIKDSVLNKVGRLTDEEYAEMKSHVTRGAAILKDFTLVEHVFDGARFHHERYDGRGYPDHLEGDEIPLYGRIIGVADAFDAMTSNRVYRNQMDTDYVMNELRRGRGAQFDPEALDAFMRLIDKGVINLEELYAQKAAEISEADQKTKEAIARRVEEDKQIQANAMRAESAGAAARGKGASA